MKFFSFILILFLASCSLSPAMAEEQITGQAIILDADTLSIGTKIIRLDGIDALELGQFCKNKKKEMWPCGVHAAELLNHRIGAEDITCIGNKFKQSERYVSTCFVGKTNLNEWIVEQGYALSFTMYTDKYKEAELGALKAGLGMWEHQFMQHQFMHPRDFRKAMRESK